MSYVQRDGGTGKVKGVYALRQAGVADEQLPDDHPDVVEYRAAPPPPARAIDDDKLMVLLRGLVAADVLTPGQARALAAGVLAAQRGEAPP